MAGQRSSFGKLQRDRDKQAKAAAKRARRQEGAPAQDEEPVEAAAPRSEASTAALLERIAEVHEQYDAGTISYEQFEETKADLLGRLSVE
ncbi:MAG TPA: hypothetical protein VM242_16755 [Acidimicrobiales bacterium]|jgi:hypothetical protein|nr:hypothetical protein [Acidimicrobiales bacterium]